MAACRTFLQCIFDEPTRLEGSVKMFGLRVATSMDVTSKKGGKIINAEGIENTPAWGKPSPWVDYTGPVGGKTVGVAIFNHPSSFRYPTTWHVRDYGLFAANLTIEKAVADQSRAYSFDALDYFFDEEHALAYAFRWGRMWIDNRQ